MPHGKHIFKHNMTWRCEQYVQIRNLIMCYHIGNLCFIVVQNVHIWILQFHNEISIIIMLLYMNLSHRASSYFLPIFWF